MKDGSIVTNLNGILVWLRIMWKCVWLSCDLCNPVGRSKCMYEEGINLNLLEISWAQSRAYSVHTSIISPVRWTVKMMFSPEWSTTQPSVPLSEPAKTLTESPRLYVRCKLEIGQLCWTGRVPLLSITTVADLFWKSTDKIVADILKSSPSVMQMRSPCCQNCAENILIVWWIKGGSIPASEWSTRSSGWGNSTTSSVFFEREHRSRPLW